MNAIPLLYYGLCLLLGIAASILFHPAYLVILALLILTLRSRLISGLIIFALGYLWAIFSVTLPTLPTLPEEGVEGKGVFAPESISYGHSPFGTSFITKGSLSFTTASATWKRIPCHIYTPLHKPRPPGNHTFIVEGRLLPKTFPIYVLKPSTYQAAPSTFSLAECRFQIKEWVRHQFTTRFSSPPAASFLLSMVTGEIDDRLMALQFNRLGLLHLLGVSGFQFSLLALLLGTCLRGTVGTWLLMILLSTYAFMLGHSPPIERAWISVIFYAIARLKGYQISPLNALGAALIWQLLLDPCVFFQLGFQFSFLCTAAIFIIYPPLRESFKRWLPGRAFHEIRSLSVLDRLGHTLTFFCREALALNCAVHLLSLPLIFFHFHKFPVLSLAYNLFLPPVVSLAYLFLIPALLLGPLGLPFLKISEFLTHHVLQVAINPPTLFDFQWRVPNFTLSWALLSITLILMLFYKRGCLLNRSQAITLN